MSVNSFRIASQLRQFIDTNHVYTDELSDNTNRKIRDAAQNEPEEVIQSGVTKRKGKARRSLAQQFPPSWEKYRDEFLSAVRKFEYGVHTQSPEKIVRGMNVAGSSNQTQNVPITPKLSTLSGRPLQDIKNNCTRNFNFDAIPRKVLSLFQGFEKLGEDNWITWKGHMQDNLEICNLWDIVSGDDEKPSDLYSEHAEAWKIREKIARMLIKNALGPKDYQQIRHVKTANCYSYE